MNNLYAKSHKHSWWPSMTNSEILAVHETSPSNTLWAVNNPLRFSSPIVTKPLVNDFKIFTTYFQVSGSYLKTSSISARTSATSVAGSCWHAALARSAVAKPVTMWTSEEGAAATACVGVNEAIWERWTCWTKPSVFTPLIRWAKRKLLPAAEAACAAGSVLFLELTQYWLRKPETHSQPFSSDGQKFRENLRTTLRPGPIGSAWMAPCVSIGSGGEKAIVFLCKTASGAVMMT